MRSGGTIPLLHFQTRPRRDTRWLRQVAMYQPEALAMWTCPKCEAKVDGGFEVCWACGASPDEAVGPPFDPERDGVMTRKDYQAAEEARRHEDLVTVAS